jgi:protein-S-isoprenylcysteine O-methyltransferase Ste14
MRKLLNALILASVAGVVGVASAAPVAAVDVADATTSLTNQIPSMTAILTAVLGLTALVMAFRWIMRTMGS